MSELLVSRKYSDRDARNQRARTRTGLIQGAAQDLLDLTDFPVNIRRRLSSDLRPHYVDTHAFNPGKANFRIAQDVNSAFQGAFLHLAGDILIKNTLPKLQEDESLIPKNLALLPDSYNRTIYSYKFADPYDSFMKVGLYYWHGAENQLFEEVDGNQMHPYYPLLQVLRKVYENFRWRQKKYDPPRGTIKDLHQRVLFGGVDNVESVMDILIARDMASNDSLSTEEITRRALGDVETISWLTSVNRNTNTNIFRYPAGYFPRQEHERMDSDAFTEFADVFTEEGEHVIFNHASLRKGPWQIPRACAGKFPLRSLERDTQQRAIDLFILAEEKSQPDTQTIHDGTYDIAKALLIVGINIGKYTIFKHRSS